MSTNKEHWEGVYATKTAEQMSWTQDKPVSSLYFTELFGLPLSAKIIDIGGGDSLLVDHLLEMGYRNITVLDISAHAIERAKQRLGKKADTVKWIVADMTDFEPSDEYDLWHDRATFHFLTQKRDIDRYLGRIRSSLSANGYLMLATFSLNGPEKCSGLPVKQYSEASMQKQLNKGFTKIKCITEDHHTPFDTLQQFVFCGFKKSTGANHIN